MLSFCYCVRTRYADVNIFLSPETATSAPTAIMQLENLMAKMSALLARIATPANFSLADPVTFNDTLVSWLADPNFTFPNGSVVGLCCSSVLSLQFPEEPLGDDGITVEFRRFLLATSLAYSGWRGQGKGDLRHSDICMVGHASGSRLIKRLDRILTPQFLSKCNRETCQVLFLLVLGAILGVGYTSALPLEAAPRFLVPEFQRSPTLWLSMKEHLCQMLAHHMIFLGSTLGIKLDTGLEQRIIETAANRWNKMESWIWAAANTAQDTQHSPSYTQQALPSWQQSADENPPYWEEEEPPPVTASASNSAPVPSLRPLQVPDLAGFQPAPLHDWSGNPQSYLDMVDEPESYGPAETSAATGVPEWATERSNSEPVLKRDAGVMPGQRHERKSRSIWLVRPYDAGPEKGMVNLHTRMRGREDTNDFRLFV